MAANRISFDKDNAAALLNVLQNTPGSDPALIAKLTDYLHRQGLAPEPVQPVQPEPEYTAIVQVLESQPEPVQQDSPAEIAPVQPEPFEVIEHIPAQPEPAPEPVQQDSPAEIAPVQQDSPAEIAPEPESVCLATVAPYISQNGEVQTVKTAIKAGLNVGLRGAAGCGKTHLVQSIAKDLDVPLYEIVCDGGTQREDVIGSRGYDGTKTYWIDGTATRALRHSRTEHVILYIDEPTCLRDDVQSALYPIMDNRRRVVLPENNGEIVQSTQSINGSPGLTVISSWNDGYRGTAALNEAMQDRYDVGLSLSYLPEDREAKLLVSRTGIDAATAAVICQIGSTLREAITRKEIVTPISTRALIAFASLVVAGFDVRAAGEHTLVEKASGLFETERTLIRDVINTMTTGQVTK